MMKIKIFYILLFLCGVIFMSSTVMAAADQRKNSIQSKGIINYANGKVIMDSSDLINLADQTDELEISYKKAKDNSVSHYLWKNKFRR